MDRTASELREIEAGLNDPSKAQRRSRPACSERSLGTGQRDGGRSYVFTPGGVIQAGQKLMDIVPEGMPLAIEAKVASADGDDVRPGQ